MGELEEGWARAERSSGAVYSGVRAEMSGGFLEEGLGWEGRMWEEEKSQKRGVRVWVWVSSEFGEEGRRRMLAGLMSPWMQLWEWRKERPATREVARWVQVEKPRMGSNMFFVVRGVVFLMVWAWVSRERGRAVRIMEWVEGSQPWKGTMWLVEPGGWEWR